MTGIPDGYKTGEVSFLSLSPRDHMLENAIGMLAFYRHRDCHPQLGGPDWEGLGREGRNAWREMVRKQLERMASEDASLGIGPFR